MVRCGCDGRIVPCAWLCLRWRSLGTGSIFRVRIYDRGMEWSSIRQIYTPPSIVFRLFYASTTAPRLEWVRYAFYDAGGLYFVHISQVLKHRTQGIKSALLAPAPRMYSTVPALVLSCFLNARDGKKQVTRLWHIGSQCPRGRPAWRK